MKARIVIGICIALIGISSMEAVSQIQITGLMRDEYALGLTPTIKSAGMGGAYVGVDRIYSMNPAALGGIDRIEGTLYYGLYDHNDGPTAHRGRLDLALKAPMTDLIADWFPALEFVKTTGIRVMVDGFITDGEGQTLLPGPGGVPFDADYDSVTLGSQWGVDVFDWLSIGGGAYPFENANMNLSNPNASFHGDALSQIGSGQYGLLLKPCDFFHVGAQYIYIKDDLEVSGPTGVMGDYFHINYFALGVAVMPFDGTLIAVDYWNGEIEGSIDQFTPFDQDVDRWNVGIEQRITDNFDLRLGSNNGGLTAGFSIHFNESMDLDYAYVNQALRDKDFAFGDTQYHGLAFTMRF